MAKEPKKERFSERRKLRFKLISVRILIPNVITLLALCSGITAIRMGIEGRFEQAVQAILFAGVLDGIDGRIARLLKGSTKFGAELDSLSDFVSFGVAPAVVIYLWALDSLNNIGWIISLILAVCMALRLARFNTSLDDDEKHAWANNYFIGVPAPAGALVAMLPLYMNFLGWIGPNSFPILILIFIAGVSLLIISQIPTFSGKTIGQRIRKDVVMPLLLLVVFIIVISFNYPWYTLTFIAIGYITTIPISYYSYKKELTNSEL